MSLLKLPGARPRVVLFDWHATLVDTRDAMYIAIDQAIPRLVEEGLIERLVAPSQCKTIEDARLVRYVRQNASLHPRIRSERKISRTDIFELLFGTDEDAKARAHAIFDREYGQLFGAVEPMEPDIVEMFQDLRGRDMRIGVLSNRKRDYMAHELWAVDQGRWIELIDVMVAGDEVARRKPAPDLILEALRRLGLEAGPACWYVGDSTTDIIAAKQAGVTAVFYNGADWDQSWIDKIFPGTSRHPHRPDAVVRDFPDLLRLIAGLTSSPED